MLSSSLAKFCINMMRKMMEEDPNWKQTWIDNIAMKLYDELHWRKYRPKLKEEDRDAIAEKLLNYLFDIH